MLLTFCPQGGAGDNIMWWCLGYRQEAIIKLYHHWLQVLSMTRHTWSARSKAKEIISGPSGPASGFYRTSKESTNSFQCNEWNAVINGQNHSGLSHKFIRLKRKYKASQIIPFLSPFIAKHLSLLCLLWYLSIARKWSPKTRTFICCLSFRAIKWIKWAFKCNSGLCNKVSQFGKFDKL